VITYEEHPELSYTQKRQHLKDLRNTIEANLARGALDTWTAFCLLQDIQLEVLDGDYDLIYLKVILESNAQVKKEYQEMYDAVTLSLSQGSSKDTIDLGVAYLVLQNIASDLLYDCPKDHGENIDVDQ
jgi:hypothetical protein